MLTLSHTHRPRRGGSTGAVLLALFGTFVALATAGYVLYRDPPWNAKTEPAEAKKSTNLLTGNLSQYDFKSPEAAVRSDFKIQLGGDFLAALELQSKIDRKIKQEAIDTLEIKKTAEFDGKTVVFVTYKRDGKDVKETHWYKHDPDAGMWVRTLETTAKVREKDRKLAAEIDAWR